MVFSTISAAMMMGKMTYSSPCPLAAWMVL
jgi:hypothetical protein